MKSSKLKNFLYQRASGISQQEKLASIRGSWQIASNLPSSFRYAFQGLLYGLNTQRNFRIHIFIGSMVLGIGFWLKLSLGNIAILVLTIMAVLVLELINTSIEAVVDLAIGRQFHPLARIAKDCAAGAVLIASLCSVLIAFLMLLPPLINQFNP